MTLAKATTLVLAISSIFWSCSEEIKKNSRSQSSGKNTTVVDNKKNGDAQVQPQTSIPVSPSANSPDVKTDNGDEVVNTSENNNTKELQLTWQANKENNLVGYNIYLMDSEDDKTTKLSSININSQDFDKNTPSKVIKLGTEYNGKKVCFAVTAENPEGESNKSDEYCVDL